MNRKTKKVVCTFLIGGTLAVVGTHLLDPKIRKKLKG